MSTSVLLAVDDRPDNLFVLEQLIPEYCPGCKVVTAQNAEEGLAIAAETRLDVILIDVQMPDMDGIEMCRRLKASKATSNIPVLLLTAHKAISELKVKGLEAGADDFIAKPIDNIELVARVKVLLRIKKAEDILRAEKGLLEKTVQERTRELQESEAQKKAILDGITTNIIFIKENMDILWVNKATIALTNKSPEELIGHKCHELWGYPEKPCDDCPAEKTFKTKKTEQVIRHTPDGKIWDLTTEPVFDDQGKLVGAVEIGHDITDKSRLEAQFQQAQRMEAVGTLAGGVAHDFNNLLMGIQGYTSLMMLETDSNTPHFEKMKNVEQLVQSGADLTRQLLGFARGGKYEVKPIDLNALTTKISGMFGRTKKEIKIHTKEQKDIWMVEADQGQIEQVFLNLCVNAWQAMPGGGDIFLETENITLDETYSKPFFVKPGNYVKLSVTDTGVGMDQRTQQRIFEPFFTTKEMGRGTGLGLASVYGIIKGHGGIITVYSEKGHGSTFNIYLPATEKKLVEEKRIDKKILRGKETVLLVDDEEHILDVGAHLLKSLGYTVIEAKNGEEAINFYKEKQTAIAMVILDMIMPGTSGGKVYDTMKEINPKIKVLLTSGYSITGQATEIMERGCDGFIQKPFNIKEMSHKLREILDKK